MSKSPKSGEIIVMFGQTLDFGLLDFGHMNLPVWLSSDSSSFVNCRAFAPRECESLRRLQLTR